MFKLTNLLVILSVYCVIAINAAPYQELAPKAGYVPVYIREGNTPLSDIHPNLVEAFHEDGQEPSQLQIDSLRTEEVAPVNNEIQENSEAIKEEEKEVIEEPQTSADLKEVESNDETIKEEPAKVEETTASDIAEFNSDDLKSLVDDDDDEAKY